MTKLEISAQKTGARSGNAAASPAAREYYLDWLRVLAILVVFFIHCSKIFDYHTTVLFNPVRSPILSIFREFALLWIMPLFFVISGAAIFLSYKHQGTGGFVKSRMKRILLPSLLIGTFVVNPPYVYMEKLFSGKTHSGFLSWYPHFFDGLYVTGKGNFAPWGMGTHIWYLQYLFIFSLILLPLFIRSRKKEVSLLERASKYVANPLSLLLLFLPVSAAAAMFEYIGLGGVRVTGRWDMISYMLFLSYGYLVFANAEIQDTIRRHCTLYLSLALVFTAVYLATHFGIGIVVDGVTAHDIGSGEILRVDRSLFSLVQAGRGFLAWSWTLAILGFGRRFLSTGNRFRRYANEAVLPFYILHHSIIYIVGFYIIRWDSPVAVKFMAISIISFTAIMAVYEIIIRRLNGLRVLFGMKVKPPANADRS